MPNPARTGSDKLVALIAEIEAEAYARGKADARKELLDVLGSGGVRAPRAKTSRGRKAKTAAAPKRRASGLKRAPKGSVRRFVEEALRDRAGRDVAGDIRARRRRGATCQAALDPHRAGKRSEAGQVRIA